MSVEEERSIYSEFYHNNKQEEYQVKVFFMIISILDLISIISIIYLSQSLLINYRN